MTTASDLSPIVTLTQQKLNVLLQARGCRSIGVDGKLGPETCGALQFIVHAGYLDLPASVHSAGLIVESNFWLQDLCTGSGSYSCQGAAPSPASPAPPPAATLPGTTAASSARSRASMSSADMVMWGTVLAAVGLVGYAVAKKKGWIK